MSPSDSTLGPNRRLDTWKEIGAFFGRDERTVKRWEITRGLPVPRGPGGGRANVYANTDELIEWLKGKNDTVESDQIGNAAASSEAGAGFEEQVNDGLSADVAGADRRVAERRSEEGTRVPSPIWRQLRYVVVAIAIVAGLGVPGQKTRNPSP